MILWMASVDLRGWFTVWPALVSVDERAFIGSAHSQFAYKRSLRQQTSSGPVTGYLNRYSCIQEKPTPFGMECFFHVFSFFFSGNDTGKTMAVVYPIGWA